MLRRTLGTFALIAVVFAVSAAPANAGGDNPSHDDRRISVTAAWWSPRARWWTVRWCPSTGRSTINGTVNGDVFVGDGDVVIRGQVTGDVLVVHGDVLITGRVGGDVVALDGRITTRDGAQVNGDVKSRQEPTSPRAPSRGERQEAERRGTCSAGS